MKSALLLALLASGLVAAPPARAQEALVLGGGGARGLAHAGVVVALERLGHDPEIVVGASMGAIIGSLYAAGYPPAEIWRIVMTEEWPALFWPQPLLLGPDREVRYPIVRLDLELARGRVGAGLVPDWRINRTLTRLLFDAQARARGDFDRLPRRFRSATADLATGRLVVLGSGDLARAVRASMAVPGAFAPVPWDNLALVDGGVANYLPIPVARELGGRPVIAVDVVRPALWYDVADPLDIALRGLRLILLNTLPAGSPPDVLVLPPVPAEITEAAFPRDPGRLLRAGLEATLATVPPAAAGPPSPRAPEPPPDSLGALVVDTRDPMLAAMARSAFRDAAPAPYDPARVLRAVDRLYATGLFAGVWPAVEPAVEPAGAARPAPTLRVLLEPMEPAALVGAAGYDNDRGARGWVALTGRPGLRAPTELRLAASANELERWVDLAARRFSLARPPLVWTGGAYVRQRDVRFFDAPDDPETPDGEPSVLRAGGWLGLEAMRIAPAVLATAGLRAESIEVDDDDGGSFGPFLRVGGIEPLVRVVGVTPVVEAELRFGEAGYGQVRASGALEGETGRLHFAALADVAAVGGDAPPDVVPALGDEHLVPGLRWGEERGRTRIVAGTDLALALPLPLDTFGRLRLRSGAAAGSLDGFRDRSRWVTGVELGLLVGTPVGPLVLAGATSTRGNWRFELSIGPEFR